MRYDNLLAEFVHLCSKSSVDNERAIRFYFHALLGAYFRKCTIKWGAYNKSVRFHFLFIQASRTGKDQINKFIKDLSNRINLNCVILTDVSSDASFIGSIDSNAKQYNSKYGLSRENPIVEIKEREYIYQDPVIRGLFGSHDVIIVSEAKTIFQVNQGETKMLSVLQPALDSPSEIVKKMRDTELIQYITDCTLILTSIPFKQMKQNMLSQGFFQRLATYIRRLDIDEIKAMRKKANTILISIDHEKFNNGMDNLAKKILVLDSSPKEIILPISLLWDINNYVDNFIERIRWNVVGDEVTNALSFSNTVQDVIMKVAGISCLIEGRTHMDNNDIKRGFMIADMFSDSIIEEIEIETDLRETSQEKILFNFIKRIIKESKEHISKGTLQKLVSEKFEIGFAKAGKKIEILAQKNFIKINKPNENKEKIVNLVMQNAELSDKNT